MDLAVVILAGGAGRRIGGDKPFRLLGGARLVDRAIAFAGSLSRDLALSVSDADQLSDCPVERIVDNRPGWGPLAGLAAGFDYARRRQADLLLTVPCDTPFLPGDLVSRLTEALTPDIAAAIPASCGRLHVACTLWRASVAAELAPYAATGGRSLHGLAERVGFVAVNWPAESLDPFFNINSGEDLARAETFLLTREN